MKCLKLVNETKNVGKIITISNQIQRTGKRNNDLIENNLEIPSSIFLHK